MGSRTRRLVLGSLAVLALAASAASAAARRLAVLHCPHLTAAHRAGATIRLIVLPPRGRPPPGSRSSLEVGALHGADSLLRDASRHPGARAPPDDQAGHADATGGAIRARELRADAHRAAAAADAGALRTAAEAAAH